MPLKGSRELRARLRAIRQTFKPIGKNWATDTRDYARGHVPVRTGRLKASIRVRNASQRRATVVGHFSAFFVDKGTKAHPEKAKRVSVMRYGLSKQGPTFGGFAPGQATVFSKKVNHPRTRAKPFRVAAAREGLRKNPMAVELIKQWNSAT